MTPLEYVQLGERLVLGIFFAISGFHKLFNGEVRLHFRGLFNRLGVARLWLPVALGELTGGIGLVVGLLTPVAAAGLVLILLGAIYLDVWDADIKGKNPRDPADWLAKIIYCPEVLMAFWLLAVILLGPGSISLDAVVLA